MERACRLGGWEASPPLERGEGLGKGADPAIQPVGSNLPSKGTMLGVLVLCLVFAVAAWRGAFDSPLYGHTLAGFMQLVQRPAAHLVPYSAGVAWSGLHMTLAPWSQLVAPIILTRPWHLGLVVYNAGSAASTSAPSRAAPRGADEVLQAAANSMHTEPPRSASP